jgi:3-deoxy-7-phosphoheptulonate synthase
MTMQEQTKTMGEEPVLKSHRRPDVETTVIAVGNVRFGDGSYPVLAGPRVVESESQIMAAARLVVEAGGAMVRAGTWRAENSPYTFRGLGEEGLRFLHHAGAEYDIPVVTELIEGSKADLVASYADMIEIGPENMQNFTLLQAAGRAGRPVILHRGPSATIDEWLMAAEYILNEDNGDVVLAEGGSRSFDPRTSESLDISTVPIVQRLSHLPVIVNPAPAKGDRDLVIPLSLASRTIGADGLMVEVHPDPASAKVGNGAQLDGPTFHRLMESLGVPLLRDEIDRIDREIIKLLGVRLHRAVEIARLKAEKGLPMRSPDREAELVAEVRSDAAALGMDPDYIEDFINLVLHHTRAAQRAAVDADRG